MYICMSIYVQAHTCIDHLFEYIHTRYLLIAVLPHPLLLIVWRVRRLSDVGGPTSLQRIPHNAQISHVTSSRPMCGSGSAAARRELRLWRTGFECSSGGGLKAPAVLNIRATLNPTLSMPMAGILWDHRLFPSQNSTSWRQRASWFQKGPATCQESTLRIAHCKWACWPFFLIEFGGRV